MGKKKTKLYKKNLKKYIVKCKRIIIIILMAILFVSILPCVNFLISTELLAVQWGPVQWGLTP